MCNYKYSNMKINFKGLLAIFIIGIMIFICHFYRNWDIPWIFVIISTSVFFGVLTFYSIDEDINSIKMKKKITPELYLTYILCILSLLIDFNGFWSWTLVFLLCVFIGFTFLTVFLSWGIDERKLNFKINFYGIFGVISIIFMILMMRMNVTHDYSYKELKYRDSNIYTLSKSEIDTLANFNVVFDNNPSIIDFNHGKKINVMQEVIDANIVSRDWFIKEVAFNTKLPWFFIISSTLLFWLILFINLEDLIRKTYDIRYAISIYLSYILCSLSLSINAIGFWTWTGILIACISIGIGIPHLLLKKT